MVIWSDATRLDPRHVLAELFVEIVCSFRYGARTSGSDEYAFAADHGPIWSDRPCKRRIWHLWVTNAASNSLQEISARHHVALAPITVGTNPDGIAIDRNGNVWVAHELGRSAQEIPDRVGTDFGRQQSVRHHDHGVESGAGLVGAGIGKCGTFEGLGKWR